MKSWHWNSEEKLTCCHWVFILPHFRILIIESSFPGYQLWQISFKKISVSYCTQVSHLKKEKERLFSLPSLPFTSIYVTKVHTQWKLLLREAVTLGKILLSWCSLFLLLVIPRSFKKNLCPLINEYDMRKALAYTLFLLFENAINILDLLFKCLI